MDIRELTKALEIIKLQFHNQLMRIEQLEKLIKIKDSQIKDLEVENKRLILMQGSYTRLIPNT